MLTYFSVARWVTSSVSSANTTPLLPTGARKYTAWAKRCLPWQPDGLA
jgi:hypothetical protein